MKPKLVTNPDDPKDPFYICREQLADLDAKIREAYPTVIITEGCKYGRWAVFEGLDDDGFIETSFGGWAGWGRSMPEGYYPDHGFLGYVFGRYRLILMWLPFFD